MGSTVDLMKLVSSLTLFGAVAEDFAAREGDFALEPFVADANAILEAALREGHERCRHTLVTLQAAKRRAPPQPTS
jgi:hypothetical protein